ncbi:uncharacterized protein LOC117327374 [Pecten maximus]|uniref:uncharacterized protein LOC117327374 n=1 Tax=Pecten maximus TaxID=6579 RepID=UPI001457F746|nr:uncharacterized protein LOC117327374 [Pecten maximus]
MAKNQYDLKDFSGSKEENLVRSVFKNIISDSGFLLPAFLNIVIQRSNAIDGKSFSDASVYLRLNYEHAEAYAKNYIEGYPECRGVYLKDILALNIFKEFLTDGVDAIRKHSTACRQSFLALFEFLRERTTHEEAIWKLAKGTSLSGIKETQIMVGLAHHLFSQLVPGKKYEVDEYAKQLPKECCCGCNATVYGGNTSVGSTRTWHGRVDIMLNHTIAVTLGNEETESTEEDDADAEPASKQRKLETDGNSDICAEVKANKKYDNIFESRLLEQILAEAITNGFAQLNRSRSTLLHFLIPTIGVTSDHVSVCLYDPEYDCLLLSSKRLRLWIPEKKILNNEIIVVIWLFLNFTVFTEQKVATKYDLDKSGLHAELKNHLQHYRKVETKESVISTSVPVKYSFCPKSK